MGYNFKAKSLATKLKTERKKKMKIKNGQLNNILRGLDELVELELRAALAFRIKSLYEKVAKQYELYAKMRNELLEKAAQRNEDGSMRYVEGTQNVYIQEEFVEQIKELEEVEGDELSPLTLSELDKSGCNVKVSTMFRLGDLLVDDTAK